MSIPDDVKLDENAWAWLHFVTSLPPMSLPVCGVHAEGARHHLGICIKGNIYHVFNAGTDFISIVSAHLGDLFY